MCSFSSFIFNHVWKLYYHYGSTSKEWYKLLTYASLMCHLWIFCMVVVEMEVMRALPSWYTLLLPQSILKAYVQTDLEPFFKTTQIPSLDRIVSWALSV